MTTALLGFLGTMNLLAGNTAIGGALVVAAGVNLVAGLVYEMCRARGE